MNHDFLEAPREVVDFGGGDRDELRPERSDFGGGDRDEFRLDRAVEKSEARLAALKLGCPFEVTGAVANIADEDERDLAMMTASDLERWIPPPPPPPPRPSV